MPPPPLFEQHDRELQPQALGCQQPADVVRERDVADQQHDRARAGGGGAESAGHGAVDAVGAAVAQHSRGVRAHGPEGLDVPDRHRGGHEQGRLLRQQDAELGREHRF